MDHKLFYSLLAVACFFLVSATNGYSFSSYGSDVNTNCGSTVFTGDCTLCHVADKAATTPAKTAYLAGGTALTDYFCPAPPPPAATPTLPTNLDRKVVGIADFDGDGNLDVLERNAVNGKWFLNLMSGDTVLSTTRVFLPIKPNFVLAGVADFDGDGNADVLLRNTNDGRWILKKMAGDTVVSSSWLNMSQNQAMQVAGIADFDGDSNADILLRNTTNGKYLVNLVVGGTIISTSRM